MTEFLKLYLVKGLNNIVTFHHNILQLEKKKQEALKNYSMVLN